MRPKLLSSTVIVVGFWLVATTLYWSFQKPDVNYQALLSLAAFAHKFGMSSWVNATAYDPSIMGSFFVQKSVLLKWTFPVLILTGIAFMVGGALTWRGSFNKDKERTARETGKGVFRDLKLTVGALPTPRTFNRDEVELSASENNGLELLSPKELDVLNQIMGTISANEDIAAKLPNGASLVEHTLSQLGKFFREVNEGPYEHVGLTTLVIAALQLGYLTAYVKGPNNTWIANGNKKHSTEASFILSGLPAWFALPPLERNALYLAVKFIEKPLSFPDLEGDPNIYPVAVILLSQAAGYGSMSLNVAPVVVPKASEEKVVRLGDLNNKLDALASEDANYKLPGADDEEAAAASKPVAPPSGILAGAPQTKPGAAPKAAQPEQQGSAPTAAGAGDERASVLAPAQAGAAKPVPPTATKPAPAAPVANPVPASATMTKPAEAQRPADSPRPPSPAVVPSVLSPGKDAGLGRQPLQMLATSDEDMEKIVFDTFIRLLPTMAFQHKGLPVGVKAVAWKQDLRVYMVEIKLRESIMEELPEQLRERLRPGKDKNRVQPLTRVLFRIFQKKGWLVTQIDGVTVSPEEASWNLHAGTLDFRGVIVLDFPEEYYHQLPEKNSMYTLRITGPLYTSSATGMKRPEGAPDAKPGGSSAVKTAANKPINSQGAKKANTTSMVDLSSVLGPSKGV